MVWASSASYKEYLEDALDECSGIIQDLLGMRNPDLVVIFVSFHHSEMFNLIPDRIAKRLNSKWYRCYDFCIRRPLKKLLRGIGYVGSFLQDISWKLERQLNK